MCGREKGSAILGIIVVIMMVIDIVITTYNVQLEIAIILGCIVTALLGATDENRKDNGWVTWIINAIICGVILIMTLNG